MTKEETKEMMFWVYNTIYEYNQVIARMRKFKPRLNMENKTVNEAHRQLVQGYYNKITLNKLSVEDILQMLESDLEEIRMRDLVIEANEVVNPEKQ